MRRDLSFWVTIRERGHDRRTGAVAEIFETVDGYGWRVIHAEGQMRGESVSQKGARAAARRFVRKLPDRQEEGRPPKQMTIFEKIG